MSDLNNWLEVAARQLCVIKGLDPEEKYEEGLIWHVMAGQIADQMAILEAIDFATEAEAHFDA